MSKVIPLFFVALLFSTGCKENAKKTTSKSSLKGKKILMIIAHNSFRDEEFKIPYDTFKSLGAQVVVASSDTSTATGMLGMKFKPDILIDSVSLDGFNAIVMPGGTGAMEYWNNLKVHKLLINAFSKGKVIAAICLSPATLANAGILQGKKATVYSTDQTLKIFKEKGVDYINQPVVADGNIITGNSPKVASDFAKKIVEALTK